MGALLGGISFLTVYRSKAKAKKEEVEKQQPCEEEKQPPCEEELAVVAAPAKTHEEPPVDDVVKRKDITKIESTTEVIWMFALDLHIEWAVIRRDGNTASSYVWIDSWIE